MLSPADQELVLRDPALQGLGLLLDEERLGAWLSDRTATPVRLRPRYLRYKRGTSCVLAGHLESTGDVQPCLVSAYPLDDSAKLTKTVERAPRGSVLGVDHVRGLLATTPAADRDLPALTRFADDDMRRRLLRTLLGNRKGVRGATLQTLRHKPHRRWVGLVDLTHGPRFVLRAYRPSEARAAVEAVGACTAATVRTPRLLAADTHRGVAVVSYVPGDVLTRLARVDPGRGLDNFRTAGAALRKLHESVDMDLRTTSLAMEAHAIRTAATQLGVLMPDDVDFLRELVSDLTTRLLSLEPVRAPVHGDFSADQVVIDASGDATLIDLDSARLGDPASDLACLAAAVTRDVVLGTVAEATGEAWLHALHDGYSQLYGTPEERLAIHRAAHLFRRAVEPFRLRQTAAWPDATRALLTRARTTLDKRNVVDGIR